MAPRKASNQQIPRSPSLPFAGNHHITSSFILRGPAEPQKQTKHPKASTLGNFQASQEGLFEKTKWITLSDFKRPDSSRAHLALGNDLIEPLNEEDAAIKVSYNPTTIARDILIAANQHPTEKALNHHLMCLRRNLPEVKFSSDLATFRWDILDPDPSTTSAIAHTSLDGSDTSMEDISDSFGPRIRSSPKRTYLEYIRPQSPCPSSPCPARRPVPLQRPAPCTPTQPNKVTKPSSSRTAFKVSKTDDRSLLSPYFSRSPQLKVVVPVSKDHMSIRQSPRRPEQAVARPKPLNIKKTAVDSHSFRCMWILCQKKFYDKPGLQAHVMKDHIMENLTCRWGNCDCKTHLAAVPLWQHMKKFHF